MIKKAVSGFYNYLLFNTMSLLRFREVAAYRLFRPDSFIFVLIHVYRFGATFIPTVINGYNLVIQVLWVTR